MSFPRDSLAVLLVLALAACAGGGRQGNPLREQPRATRIPPPGPTATLSGRITDRDTGLALVGAAVVAQDAGRPKILASATTAADGSFTLAQLPLGVPIRVVSQPVTGALAYSAEASAPLTLAQDTPAPPVNLACTRVAQAGRVEGARSTRPGPVHKVALVQERDLGGGDRAKLLIRVARTEPDGSFQFASLPPGNYEVHFLDRGDHPPRPHHHHSPHPPRRRPHPPHERRMGPPRPQQTHHPMPPDARRLPPGARVVIITVPAAQATHVSWPARMQGGAVEPEEADLQGDEAYDLP